ncbi:MAG: hypothetical protein V4507_15920 [Verrucomicrobiota bacterium]
MNKITLFSLLLFTSLILRVTSQTVLLNEDFSDGSRTNQALPASSAWFSSTAGSLSVLSGALTRNGAGSIITYFTNSGAPIQLAVGEKLRVTYSLILSGTPPTAPSPVDSFLRVGLYNSHGTSSDANATTTATRFTADSFGTITAAVANYSGYLATAPYTPTATNKMQSFEKLSDSSSASLSSIGTQYEFKNFGGTDLDFVFGNTYSTSFEMTRTTLGMTGVFGITGDFINSSGVVTTTTQSITFTDNTTPVYTFDTFAYMPQGPSMVSSLDNFVVTYFAVPEPMSGGIIFLGSGVFFAVYIKNIFSKRLMGSKKLKMAMA